MNSRIDDFKLDDKLSKGKAYYIISSLDNIESEFIIHDKNYIVLNSLSNTVETELIPNYFKENESFFKEHDVDINKTGFNAKFFELFFTKEISNYDVFYINSVGLSYSSIAQLTDFFYQQFKVIENKTLFFVHSIDSSSDSKIVIVKEINSETSMRIENVLKKYKDMKPKILKF